MSDTKTTQHLPGSSSPPKYWIFPAAGVRGFHFLGTLFAIDEMFRREQHPLKGAAGTSAGAAYALAICVNASLSQAMECFFFLDLQSVMTESRGISSLVIGKDMGLVTDAHLRKPIQQMLMATLGQPDVTFRQLFEKTGKFLSVNRCQISTGKNQYSDPELTPNLSVVEAVVSSMAMPVLFDPVRGADNELYADGGIMQGLLFPHYRFPTHETVALAFEDALTPVPSAMPENSRQYMMRVCQLLLNSQSTFQYEKMTQEEKSRIILLKTTQLSWDFRISQEARSKQVEHAIERTLCFFGASEQTDKVIKRFRFLLHIGPLIKHLCMFLQKLRNAQDETETEAAKLMPEKKGPPTKSCL